MRRSWDCSAGRRAGWVIAVIGGVFVVGAGSCLVPNAEHCAFEYGDASCREEGTSCILPEARTEHDESVNGCGGQRYGFVGVPYGLPTKIQAADGRPNDPRSVQGLLVELGYSGACLDVEVLEERFGGVVDGVAEVRRHLEKRGRARRAAVALTEEHIAALGAFRESILAWAAECGEEGTTGTETLASSSGMSESESGTSTTDLTTTGEEPCIDDAQCMARDHAKPFCDSDGICVDCRGIPVADEPCATLDPLAPLCVDGVCVACGETTVCEEQLLVCDADTRACVPCTTHDQCEAGACDLLAATPTCFEPENVFEVGMAQTYPTIGAALTAVDFMMLDRAVLRLHDGQDFNEARTVSSGAIAFVAAPGDDPHWTNNVSGVPTLTVNNANTRVYIDQMRIQDNTAGGSRRGLVCDGAAIHVKRSRVVQNNGGGITATNGCDLHVHNSFVEGGGSNNGTAGLIVNDSSANLTYSTFFNYSAITSIAVECAGISAVTSRNSIIVTRNGAPGTEIACPMLDASHTVAETLLPGPSNFNAGPFPDGSPEDWFVAVFSGDFHLQNNALTLFENVAEWQTGDPITDLDGDPRPSTNNAPDYPGADVP